MTTPLAGIRVVELGTMITCPLAGMILAELGADVIKVERPDGDPFRASHHGADSPQFLAFNKGKRSVVLDLNAANGQATLAILLERADVLIENFRPGVLERLGFDAARLRTINPAMIHCSITGFGPEGPYKHRPSYDTVGQALAGITSLIVDDDVPRVSGPTFSDNITGMYAVIGILGALVERSRGGASRHVDLSMLEGTIALIPDIFARLFVRGHSPGPYDRVASSQSFVLRCLDGRLIGVHLSTQEKFWTSFLDAVDSADLRADPAFACYDARVENYHRLYDALRPIFAAHERAFWTMQLERHDVPFAPVYNAADVVADEQVQHLGIFAATGNDNRNRNRMVLPPFRFDGARNDSIGPPPMLGEHTSEILAEIDQSRMPVK